MFLEVLLILDYLYLIQDLFKMARVPQGFTARTVSDGASRPHIKPRSSDIYEAVMTVRKNSDDSKSLIKVFDIRTPLPQNYSFSLSSEFNSPFNQPMSEFVGGQNATVLEKLLTLTTGATTQNKWLSAAIWSGGSEFSIEVPFVLQAFSDPVSEVIIPMKNLLKLAAPSEGETLSGMLSAPGPRPAKNDPDKGDIVGDIITVEIGRFFKMSPCVIGSVTEDFDTQMDSNGNPIGAVVRVQFKSFWTCTKQDLDKMFLTSAGN